MTVDHRKYCSLIRDQIDCGSCSAFGAIGIWEAQIRLDNNDLGDPIDLSERDLFFCSGGGCDTGNTMPATLNHAVNGVCIETCCPYDAEDHVCGEGRCFDWQKTGKKLDSWKTVTDKTIMKQLLDSGHVLVGTMMVHQSFMNYVSGVYHSLGIFDPILGGHCIGIVGYSDEEHCWIGRNSWGTEWGMNGYFKIAYGDSQIDVAMYQLTLSDKPPLPGPSPTPSPCKYGNGSVKIANFLLWLTHRTGRYYYLNPPRYVS